jgi:hypothetical protein
MTKTIELTVLGEICVRNDDVVAIIIVEFYSLVVVLKGSG